MHAQKIEAEGPIELSCDIHPQMTATILSLDTPYYSTPDSADHGMEARSLGCLWTVPE